MISFDLCVNSRAVTTFRAVRMIEEERIDEASGREVFRYAWTAWRPDHNATVGTLSCIDTGEVDHSPDEGLEELALRVLADFRENQRAHQSKETHHAP